MTTRFAATVLCASSALAVGLLLPAIASGETLALIIGVNECPEYVLADGTRPRPLQGAEADATDVAALLKQRYGVAAEGIRLLLGAKARLADVQAAQRDLQQIAKADDVLVFYFAGHGTQLKDARPLDEEDRRDEALCLADARADGQNLLRDDQLGRWLEEFPAQRVTAILDCCHAGTGIKDVEGDLSPRFLPSPDEFLAAAADESPWLDLQSTAKSGTRQIVALFACQPHQRAYERRLPGQPVKPRRGQFTASLLAAIHEARQDAGTGGEISHAQAMRLAKDRLDAAFNKYRPKEADRQTPQLSGPADQPLFWMKEVPSDQQ